MTPIINPWWFYFFNLISNLLDVSCTSIVVVGFIMFLGITHSLVCNDGEMPAFIKSKAIKIYVIFCLICTIVLPSEKTMYQMAATSLITSDNITTSTTFITNIITDIIDTVDEALEE